MLQKALERPYFCHINDILENTYQQNGSLPLIFIPHDNPYLSFFKSVKSKLSQEIINVLQDWEYCKLFWELIIELSVLSYTTEFKKSPKRIGNRWVVDLHKVRNDNFNELVAFIKEE